MGTYFILLKLEFNARNFFVRINARNLKIGGKRHAKTLTREKGGYLNFSLK